MSIKLSNVKIALKNYLFILKLAYNSSKIHFIALMGLSVLSIAVNPITLLLGKKILDALVNIEGNSADVILFVGLVVGISVFSNLINNVQNVIKTLIGQIVGNHLTKIILEKSTNLDLKYFDSSVYYEAQKNVQRTINSEWEFLVIGCIELINTCVSAIIMIGILAHFNIWLVPIAIVGTLPGAFVGVWAQRKNFDFFTHQIPEMRKMDYLKYILTNPFFAKEVKLFQNGGYFIGKYLDAFKIMYKDRKKLSISIAIKQMLANMISGVTNGGCQIYIALKAFNKIITIGDYSLYFGAVQSIRDSIARIIDNLTRGFEQMLLADVLTDYINLKPGIETGKGIAIESNNGIPTVEFKNVSFKYPGSEDYVVNNLNFKIEPGEKIALVGRNGTGKTTIVKLITRLYDVTAGEVLVNGKDIKSYKPEDIYRLYSAVFQDYAKYALTVKENISIGDLGEIGNQKKYKTAAKEAGLNDTINNLPEKYETYITKLYEMTGYPDLSIGEWQKVSIARAFFRPASIYILDEPTASLDAVSEHRIFENFLKLNNGKTSLLISHRLSSVRMADKILYLKNGKIVESGHHDELIKLNGEYAKLFNLQSSKYKDGPIMINHDMDFEQDKQKKRGLVLNPELSNGLPPEPPPGFPPGVVITRF